jgi:hypothetical protein
MTGADIFADVQIWCGPPASAQNEITSQTGFVPAETTNPNTPLLGSTRGTYALQSASDGTKRLTIFQHLRGANAGSVAGTFGVPMV